MFHYPCGMRLVNGELRSEVGIRVMVSGRCEHGVVDGDKPFLQTGPRCGMCREGWYANESGKPWNRTATCPSCGEKLHISYKPTSEGYVAHCWSHGAGSIWCKRSAYVIRGEEANYNFYGWGKWETEAVFLTNQFMDALERHDRYSHYSFANAA